MMKNKVKIGVVAMVVALLVGVYNQCGSSSDVDGSGEPVKSSLQSVTAFEQTVYPITRSHCLSCHRSVQQPFHASDDVSVAHDAIINGGKVDFNQIDRSRLGMKLRDEKHNCWSDCSQNADEMFTAVQKWKELAAVEAEVFNGITTGYSRPLNVEISDHSNDEVQFFSFETATVRAPMMKSGQGDATYITTSDNNQKFDSGGESGAGSAHLYINSGVGIRKVWAQVNGPSGSSNSFFYRWDNIGNYREWHFDVTEGFNWQELGSGEENFNNEVSVLSLTTREDGSQISKIAVTRNFDLDASKIDEASQTILTFNLKDSLGENVYFKINVAEMDDYSWVFSRPRIDVTGLNVHVEGLKVMLNGDYDPQNSTYEKVRKIVHPDDSLISPASLVAMKVNSDGSDTVRFAFDVLKLTGQTYLADDGSGSGPTIDPVSVGAFEQTVYGISRTYCRDCHRNIQRPFHAADNVIEAHQAVLTYAGGKVNFNNIPQSRLVERLRVDEHNCWSECEQNAQEMEAAIESWRQQRGQ